MVGETRPYDNLGNLDGDFLPPKRGRVYYIVRLRPSW